MSACGPSGPSQSGNRADVREFLISRRARISPDQAALPVTGRRRVPGLRREEVAMLAGVSVDWCTCLEKGHTSGVSREVLDPGARDFHGDWHLAADMLVAALRTEAGRNPHDVETRELVGELTTTSADFRARWSTHNILVHARGTKHFRHPETGRLSVTCHSLGLPVSVGETRHLCVCTAEPGSVDEDEPILLASLGAPGRAGRSAHRGDGPGHSHDPVNRR